MQPRSGSRAGARGWAVRAILLAAGALAGRADASSAQAAEPPPAESLAGKWYGEVGPPTDRVGLGLELASGADGRLAARVVQPVMNYFGVELPSGVRREGERLVLADLGLELALRGERLVGTLAPGFDVALDRVERLPEPAPIPDVPSGPEPRWVTKLGGAIYAAPAVLESEDGAVLYVGTTGGTFNAVRASDGGLLWVFAAGRPIFGEALVTQAALYFACDNGWLFKLERATGKELWRLELGDAAVSRVLPHPEHFGWDLQGPRPALADGTVFVGSGDGSLHAVDAKSGARRWRFASGARIRTGALVDGPRVVVGSYDGNVYALERATGRELWRRATGGPIDTAPVAAAGRVIVGNRGPGLAALDAQTGEPAWLAPFWGSWVESTPVLAEGLLYVGASDLRRVSALDPQDGRVIWRSDVYGWTWGTPLVTAERVYVGAAGGSPYFLEHAASLTALERATGAIVWRRPWPEVLGAHQWGLASSPVLAGDLLVVASLEGALFAFALE